jgi:hypothetical protein
MTTVRFLMPIRASLSLLEWSGNKESLARASMCSVGVSKSSRICLQSLKSCLCGGNKGCLLRISLSPQRASAALYKQETGTGTKWRGSCYKKPRGSWPLVSVHCPCYITLHPKCVCNTSGLSRSCHLPYVYGF